MSPISGSGARSGSGASSGSGAKPGSVPNSGSAKTPPLSGDSSSRERAEGACVPSVEVPRTSSLLLKRFYHTCTPTNVRSNPGLVRTSNGLMQTERSPREQPRPRQEEAGTKALTPALDTAMSMSS